MAHHYVQRTHRNPNRAKRSRSTSPTESVHEEVFRWTDPFTARVREFPTPAGFKMHAKEVYDGSTDPLLHVYHVHDTMSIYRTPDEMLCRVFPSTLRGNARMWFAHLKPNTIDSFGALAKAMCGFFAGSSRPHHHTQVLRNIVQCKGEPLRDYFRRFNSYAIGIPDLSAGSTEVALLRGTTSMLLAQRLAVKDSTTAGEVFKMAIEIIDQEEKLIALGHELEPLVRKSSTKKE